MDDEIEEVLRARDTSFWLLGALQTALERDPVDALHDAQLLARLMQFRARLSLEGCLSWTSPVLFLCCFTSYWSPRGPAGDFSTAC